MDSVSQGRDVDRISLALQARAAQVALDVERERERCLRRQALGTLLDRPPCLDADYLLGLLTATWERMPAELISVPWSSPTASDQVDQLQEVLAIGAAVADVFTVSEGTGRMEA